MNQIESSMEFWLFRFSCHSIIFFWSHFIWFLNMKLHGIAHKMLFCFCFFVLHLCFENIGIVVVSTEYGTWIDYMTFYVEMKLWLVCLGSFFRLHLWLRRWSYTFFLCIYFGWFNKMCLRSIFSFVVFILCKSMQWPLQALQAITWENIKKHQLNDIHIADEIWREIRRRKKLNQRRRKRLSISSDVVLMNIQTMSVFKSMNICI